MLKSDNLLFEHYLHILIEFLSSTQFFRVLKSLKSKDWSFIIYKFT